MVFRKTETDLERFHRSYSVDANGCWIWTRKREKRRGRLAYGKFSVRSNGDRKMPPAHRWIFQQIHGPLPMGILVLHRCDVPGCVNPDHLYAGTHQQNMNDRKDRDRHDGKRRRGANHPLARLSNEQANEIRRRALAGESQRKLAKEFGISQPHVSRLKTRFSKFAWDADD